MGKFITRFLRFVPVRLFQVQFHQGILVGFARHFNIHLHYIMSRSIGNEAVCGGRLLVPVIGTDQPSYRTNKVYLGGNPANPDVVLDVKDVSGNTTHLMLQAGTTYNSAIEPMTATSRIGAGLPFDDIRTKKLTWDDGTFQTTAAVGGATPGLAMVGVNTIAPAPSFVSGDLVTAGALGEVGRWKIVVPNFVCSDPATFGMFMTRAGGAQLAGTTTGINYDTTPPDFLAPLNVVFPGVNIPLTIDPVAPATHSQLEIDICQKSGDYGSVAIRYCYFSDSGRFRTVTRNFQTIPPNDMSGFYIRPSAGTCQGTIYVYKYSSV